MLFTTTLRIVRDCVFTYIELHCYYIVKRGCLERPVSLRKKAQSYCDGDTQVYSVTFFATVVSRLQFISLGKYYFTTPVLN